MQDLKLFFTYRFLMTAKEQQELETMTDELLKGGKRKAADMDEGKGGKKAKQKPLADIDHAKQFFD